MTLPSKIEVLVVRLAAKSCSRCWGVGVRESGAVCNCCYRNIFREVYMRYILIRTGSSTRIVWHHSTTPSRPQEDFMADVEITAKRLLPAQLYCLFQCHYIEQQGWREACVTLGMERGAFFHQAYRTEQMLGRIWLSLKPYALWPLDEYFLPMIFTGSKL